MTPDDPILAILAGSAVATARAAGCDCDPTVDVEIAAAIVIGHAVTHEPRCYLRKIRTAHTN